MKIRATLVIALVAISLQAASLGPAQSYEPAQSPVIAMSFSGAPDTVTRWLSDSAIHNGNTNSALSHYVVLQTYGDLTTGKGLQVGGQSVTTVAFQDRHGRNDSNNNFNVFLAVRFIGESVISVQGIQLGGDSISVRTSSNSTILPISAEIKIPSSTGSVNVTQKVRDYLNVSLEPPEVPQPILNFLNNNMELADMTTHGRLAHFSILQTTPDIFADKVLGIKGQFVTTLAFGSQDSISQSSSDTSNSNLTYHPLNIFLQISHTSQRINSLRGIQLSNDNIHIILNGIDAGQLTKSTSVPVAGGKRIVAVVRDVVPDTSGFLAMLKTHLRAGDYVIEWGNGNNFITIVSTFASPSINKGVAYFSLAKLQADAANVKNHGGNVIAYDFEGGGLSPQSDLQGGISSVQRAASVAHSLGLQFFFVTNGNTIKSMVNDVGQYCDIIDFQGQILEKNVEQYQSWVQSTATKIKAANPNCLIVNQVGPFTGTITDMMNATAAVTNANLVDGVTYWYDGTTTSVIDQFLSWYRQHW